jgi:hypothetical protein
MPLVVFAQAIITISPNLPGSLTSVSSPGAWIKSFYNYALFISGLLAFGAIVYGGIKYAIARGNPSAESDARQWIWSALLGILLLACAYLILYTVNPNLVNLNLPSLGGGGTAQTGGGGGGTPQNGGGNPVTSNCASGQCQTLPNCTPAAKTNCGGAQGMVNTLDCLSSKGVSYTVNEGYPPTVDHDSSCHNNGCCVDVHVPNSNCAAASAVVSAAKQCGATAANEYAGCSGSKKYNSTTGGNVHVNARKGQGGC